MNGIHTLRYCRALTTTSFFLLTFFFSLQRAEAAQVDEATSRAVARHFLNSATSTFGDVRSEDLQLVHAEIDAIGERTDVLYRIYDVEQAGFIIVSGDDLVLPVLGYSTSSTFPAGPLPVQIAKWFEGYRQQIREAIAGAEQVIEVQLAWQELLAGPPTTEGADRAVGPLLTTTWNQSPYYNALCPGGSVTGCVATAMAQVMNYHEHPAQGAGFHSYNAPNYGTLSANFGATTYDWASMPNNVTAANNAVATLMFHVGVSVDMQYSPQVSGAWVIESNSPSTDHNSEYALKNYFGYSTEMQGLKRENYTDQQWKNMVKADLDASRPILYAGWGSGGGHAFVCDGYDNNDFFHFNWGWGGQADGYFTLNALNPGSTGTGGGTGGYNSGHQAIFGVRPADGGGGTGTVTNDMGLYNFVMPSSSMLYYGEAFSVSTNIINNGTNEFNGDYCAAAFDASSNFYGFIETLTNNSLPSGYTYNNDIVFSTTGLLSMVPGTYYIGIFYRPTGGEWVLVANNSGYTNLTQVTVINPNDIELNAAMTVSPGTTVTQGSPLSVNLNIINDGWNTFVGEYAVSLYNLDGSWAQDIGSLNENTGLPSGYTYLSPFLTFGPTAITVPPGTYLLAAQHNPNNSGWQLTGSSYFSNPVFVNVVAAGESPDQYEANNAVAQSYTLPVNFSGNTATTTTTGSNLHNNTDQDHYKIVLAGGNNYSISARLHDAYNSGNGNTYTVDGMFSYSTDGTNWSPLYDDLMNGEIVVNGGGTVYFHVAPYFQGETGSYLLDLDIVRGLTVGVDGDAMIAPVRIHPNPASDRLTIDASGSEGGLMSLKIFDPQGRLVLQPQIERGSMRIDVPTDALTEGAYLLQLGTSTGIATERLIITR